MVTTLQALAQHPELVAEFANTAAPIVATQPRNQRLVMPEAEIIDADWVDIDTGTRYQNGGSVNRPRRTRPTGGRSRGGSFRNARIPNRAPRRIPGLPLLSWVGTAASFLPWIFDSLAAEQLRNSVIVDWATSNDVGMIWTLSGMAQALPNNWGTNTYVYTFPEPVTLVLIREPIPNSPNLYWSVWNATIGVTQDVVGVFAPGVRPWLTPSPLGFDDAFPVGAPQTEELFRERMPQFIPDIILDLSQGDRVYPGQQIIFPVPFPIFFPLPTPTIHIPINPRIELPDLEIGQVEPTPQQRTGPWIFTIPYPGQLEGNDPINMEFDDDSIPLLPDINIGIDICNQPCIQELLQRTEGINEIQERISQTLERVEPITQIQATLNLTRQAVQNSFTIVNSIANSTVNLPPEVEDSIEELNTLIQRIYAILGGNDWFRGSSPELNYNPEERFDQIRRLAFPDNKDSSEAIKVKSLIELLALHSAVVRHRAGHHELPAKVPATLLAYTDTNQQKKIPSELKLWEWYITQFDALLGKFPIKIKIKDADPTQAGDQEKEIELPNLSEALAEVYGLLFGTSFNADLSINFLMRLAAEVVATKNATLITQDHAKAISAFLGYKGNPKKREINYAFNPNRLETVEGVLEETEGYIVGWQNDDPQTAVDYFMKLSFSAGIIRSVFLRTPDQLREVQQRIQDLLNTEDDDRRWEEFKREINDPNSAFNLFGRSPFPPSRVRDRPTGQPPGQDTSPRSSNTPPSNNAD